MTYVIVLIYKCQDNQYQTVVKTKTSKIIFEFGSAVSFKKTAKKNQKD